MFGSNSMGQHTGGAAAHAMCHFGAVWGQGEGLQGQSYAIPTTDGLDRLREAVNRFVAYTMSHPEQRFLVTAIGCGHAGWSEREVAPLFRGCVQLSNVALPDSFWHELGLKPIA